MQTSLVLTIEDIKKLAAECSLDVVGVTSADSFDDVRQIYLERYAKGYFGEMRWITPERINLGCSPQDMLPGARSILVFAYSYLRDSSVPNENDGVIRGRVARYALGEDYHYFLKEKIELFLDKLKVITGKDFASRISVDSGPVIDRAVAARAGIGWYGKNTNILIPGYGSWVLLGTALVDIDLPLSSHIRKSCGSCTRCISACPTGALVAPGVLDSRRCISYLTIELKGPIPRDLRPLIGDWIFGCDICQEVCPVNIKGKKPNHPEFSDLPGWGHRPDLISLMRMTEDEFRNKFRRSPVKRTKRRGLLRNVAVALGNSGDRRAVPVLVEALSDHEPLVRGHAAWALGRLGGSEAKYALESRLQIEEDSYVREEIQLALDEIEV